MEKEDFEAPLVKWTLGRHVGDPSSSLSHLKSSFLTLHCLISWQTFINFLFSNNSSFVCTRRRQITVKIYIFLN